MAGPMPAASLLASMRAVTSTANTVTNDGKTVFVAYQKLGGVTEGLTEPLLKLQDEIKSSPTSSNIHIEHDTRDPGEELSALDAATTKAISGFWRQLGQALDEEKGRRVTQSTFPDIDLSASRPSFPTQRDWKGRTVLVTGASSGIGEATAMLLASKGARVVAVARREPELRALADKARAKACSGAISPVSVDVTQKDSLTQAIADWCAHHDDARFAAVFHCAGSACVGLFDRLGDTQIRSTIDLNVSGTLHILGLSKYIEDGGSLAVVSSALAAHALSFAPLYPATKRAQHDAAQAARDSLEKRGISVTSVLAGAFNSAIWSQVGVRPSFHKLIAFLRRLLIASSASAAKKMLKDVAAREPYSYPGTGAKLLLRFRNPGGFLPKFIRRVCPFFFGHN